MITQTHEIIIEHKGICSIQVTAEFTDDRQDGGEVSVFRVLEIEADNLDLLVYRDLPDGTDFDALLLDCYGLDQQELDKYLVECYLENNPETEGGYHEQKSDYPLTGREKLADVGMSEADFLSPAEMRRNS